MRSMHSRSTNLPAKLLLIYFLFLLALPLVTAVASAGHAPGHRMVEIEVTARNYAYDPERIIVREGDHVRLRIRTVDVAHGFFLDGYDIN
ncbi:MAG: hypothetical protein ACE5IO_04630, partial [Thermoplasmata archaeon]